jgi:hypothetical protein
MPPNEGEEHMNRMVITRIGILSLAKIQGIICAVVGLIIGLIYGLVMVFMGTILAAVGSREGGGAALGGLGVGIIGGIFMIVVMVIFYAVMGFVAGAISALIYNIAAGFMGGLELDYEVERTEYAAPPAPQQTWTPAGYSAPGV